MTTTNDDYDYDVLGTLILRLFIRFFFGRRRLIFWHRPRAVAWLCAYPQKYKYNIIQYTYTKKYVVYFLMTRLSLISTVQLSRPICQYIREYIGTVCCSVCVCMYSLHVHYSHRTGPSFRIIAQSTAAAVACNIHTHNASKNGT